jgi:hypothetical protein
VRLPTRGQRVLAVVGLAWLVVIAAIAIPRVPPVLKLAIVVWAGAAIAYLAAFVTGNHILWSRPLAIMARIASAIVGACFVIYLLQTF